MICHRSTHLLSFQSCQTDRIYSLEDLLLRLLLPKEIEGVRKHARIFCPQIHWDDPMVTGWWRPCLQLAFNSPEKFPHSQMIHYPKRHLQIPIFVIWLFLYPKDFPLQKQYFLTHFRPMLPENASRLVFANTTNGAPNYFCQFHTLFIVIYFIPASCGAFKSAFKALYDNQYNNLPLRNFLCHKMIGKPFFLKKKLWGGAPRSHGTPWKHFYRPSGKLPGLVQKNPNILTTGIIHDRSTQSARLVYIVEIQFAR